MAFIHRAGGASSSFATSYNKTITPALTGGGVLWVVVSNEPLSTLSTPTLTMTGATFTLVNAQTRGTTQRLTVWYSQDYDPGAGQTLTISTAPNTSSQVMWSVEEETDGKNSGGSPVTQVNGSVDTASDKTHTVTLAAGSGRLFATAWTNDPDTFSLSGATKLVEIAGSGPSTGLVTFWSETMQTNPTITWVTWDVPSLMIALEAASAAVPQAEIAWAKSEIPDAPTPQAEIAWATAEVPDVPLPPEGQVAFARLEVPDAPVVPDPWDPAPECETMEYRNPAGEVVRFRTLVGTVGRFMPPIGITTIPVPASHGSHYLGAAHLERPVAVPVAIPGPLDGRADLRTWARILDPSVGEGTLTVVEGTWAGRRLRCVYEAGLDEWAEMHRRYNQGTLLFRAAWPYWEDSNEFTVDTDQEDISHTWFPFLPLVFGASDAFSLFTVDNTGDVDAWPVITVYGPGEDVSVTNITTGASWTVTGPMLPGSVLEVDHRPGHKTVRLDGVNAFDQLTETSSLWPLVRGVNQVEVGAIDTDVDTLITFTWRRLWLAA